jgi:predicted ATP-grasp superfamily ATP-dependent carboligase
LRILIVGVSTRAIAESAAATGQNVVTLDYFGDLDQKTLVENHALHRDFQMKFSPTGLLWASKGLEAGAVIYLSNIENYPGIVKELAEQRVLLGNSPSVLRRVRNWRSLRFLCQTAGLACPVTILPGEELPVFGPGRWLVKPVRGGSGHGIRFWNGDPLPQTQILQSFVPGQPASAVFVADGRRSVLLGLSEQLIGRSELGADGFTWSGNILPHPDGGPILAAVERMVRSLTLEFGLRGVNGADFVIARNTTGQPYPCLVEVNPRYTGAMELVERITGLNIFTLHLNAMAGQLPDFCLQERLQSITSFWGKGIVYARQTVTMPDTAGWSNKDRRDVPFPGERILAGQPVCTVLAQGRSRDECWMHLLDKVSQVRQEIGDKQEPTTCKETRHASLLY